MRSTVSWNSREAHSLWTASAIFAPSNGAKVEKALREEIARALKDGFTRRSFRRPARAAQLPAPRARAQDASIAATLANNLDLGSYAYSQKIDRPSPRSRWPR